MEDVHRAKVGLRTELGVNGGQDAFEGWEAVVNDGRLVCGVERGREDGR